MSQALPIVYLARHGETAWTLTGNTRAVPTCRSQSMASVTRGSSESACADSVLPRCLQARYSVPNGLASWQALDLWLKSIEICSNGIMASMRAALQPTSTRSGPIGNCFAMAARWRIGKRRWSARRQDRETCARGQKRRAALLQRAFPTSVCRSFAGAGCHVR
jgi:hypothetical protein